MSEPNKNQHEPASASDRMGVGVFIENSTYILRPWRWSMNIPSFKEAGLLRTINFEKHEFSFIERNNRIVCVLKIQAMLYKKTNDPRLLLPGLISKLKDSHGTVDVNISYYDDRGRVIEEFVCVCRITKARIAADCDPPDLSRKLVIKMRCDVLSTHPRHDAEAPKDDQVHGVVHGDDGPRPHGLDETVLTDQVHVPPDEAGPVLDEVGHEDDRDRPQGQEEEGGGPHRERVQETVDGADQ